MIHAHQTNTWAVLTDCRVHAGHASLSPIVEDRTIFLVLKREKRSSALRPRAVGQRLSIPVANSPSHQQPWRTDGETGAICGNIGSSTSGLGSGTPKSAIWALHGNLTTTSQLPDCAWSARDRTVQADPRVADYGQVELISYSFRQSKSSHLFLISYCFSFKTKWVAFPPPKPPVRARTPRSRTALLLLTF